MTTCLVLCYEVFGAAGTRTSTSPREFTSTLSLRSRKSVSNQPAPTGGSEMAGSGGRESLAEVKLKSVRRGEEGEGEIGPDTER